MATHSVEDKLAELFVKIIPWQLPKDSKEWLVEYSPFIGLFLGIIGLLLAWGFWGIVHSVSQIDSTFNTYYGVRAMQRSNINAAFWLAFSALLVWSVLNIVAFFPLRARQLAGWRLLFYGLLTSGLYSIFYGWYYHSTMDVVMRFILVIIGLYLLFQVRSYYDGSNKELTVDNTTKRARS